MKDKKKLIPRKYMLYSGETLLATVYSYDIAIQLMQMILRNYHISKINLVTLY